jgi:hypothetical protein
MQMFARLRVAIVLLASVTSGVIISSENASRANPAIVLAASSGPPIRLSATPIRVLITPTSQAEVLRAPKGLDDRKVFLVIDGLTAMGTPGATYDVFLGPDGRTMPARDDPSYAGTLNFFDISNRTPADARIVSFDVTPILARLLQNDGIGYPLAVTFLPDGPPTENSEPGFARLRLMIP